MSVSWKYLLLIIFILINLINSELECDFKIWRYDDPGSIAKRSGYLLVPLLSLQSGYYHDQFISFISSSNNTFKPLANFSTPSNCFYHHSNCTLRTSTSPLCKDTARKWFTNTTYSICPWIHGCTTEGHTTINQCLQHIPQESSRELLSPRNSGCEFVDDRCITILIPPKQDQIVMYAKCNQSCSISLSQNKISEIWRQKEEGILTEQEYYEAYYKIIDELYDNSNDVCLVQATHDFDFCAWIIEYNLNDIRQCFIDHNMITLDTLDMNHPYFSELMADLRIIKNAHLIQNIVHAMQSLQKRGQQQNENVKDPIIPTETEQNVLLKLEEYIVSMEHLEKTLNDNEIKHHFEDQKEQHKKKFDAYYENEMGKIEKNIIEINGVFEKLQVALTQKHEALNEEMQRRKRIMSIRKDRFYKNLPSHPYGFYFRALNVAEEIEYYNNIIDECKQIIQKYDEKSEIEHKNEKRIAEIIDIGNMAAKYYQNRMDYVHRHNQTIQTHLKNTAKSKKEFDSVIINDDMYQQIMANIDAIINIK